MTERTELKYLLSADTAALLAVKAAALMPRDAHAGSDGCYTVRSLYFDTPSDACLWESVAGGDPRAKYRLRYYGDDPASVRLEKKTKHRQLGHKDSCRLTPEELSALLRGEPVFPAPEAEPVKRRLLTEMAVRGFVPKVIVTYSREAFVYPGGNVRVTLDRALTSSHETGHFLTPGYAERPVYASGQCILEVKFDALLPRHIRDTLQTEELVRTAFSKYYHCRMLHL